MRHRRSVILVGMGLIGAPLLLWSVAATVAAQNPPRITGGASVDQDEDQPKPVSVVARIGEPAPDFSLQGVDGTTYSLSDFKGRIVVLEWCNPRCPISKDLYERGLPQRIHVEALEHDDQVVWLAINSTSDTTERENTLWIKKHGLENPVLLDADGSVGRAYDARTTPHLFVIDAEGRLAYMGAFDDDPNGIKAKKGEPVTNYVLNAVAQLAANERVRPATTKPYGCNIKFKAADEGEGSR